MSAVLLLAMAAGCSAPHPTPAPTDGPLVAPNATCQIDADLVPGCGTLVGVTAADDSLEAFRAAEQARGGAYSFAYRFHGYDEDLPDAVERVLLAEGRQLHLTISSRRHGEPGSDISWAQVAQGAIDAELTRQAEGIAGIGRPVWLTFEHEPDNPSKWQSRGTAEDYVAAWRHVHDLFEAAGATNVRWTWVLMGTLDSTQVAASFYPGDDVVDWLSWSVYNPSGCRAGAFDGDRWMSFETSLNLFFTWLKDRGHAAGIDVDKPVMISESGSVADPDDPDRRVQWYSQIAPVLQRHPQVKAIGLWDRQGNGVCDYRFSGDRSVVAASATTRQLQPGG